MMKDTAMTMNQARRANPRRGEVEAVVGERRLVLCLTLGALAELEAAFGVQDLQALGERFARGTISSRDVVRILGAGVRGAGTPLSDEEIAALPLVGTVEAVVRLLEATFGPAPQEPSPTASIALDPAPPGDIPASGDADHQRRP